MKRIMSILAIGSLALGSVITFGMGSASAATTTPTVVLSGAKGTFPGSTPPLVATTSVAGAVTFTVGGATISGCSAVATTTVTPFIASCTYTPTAAGAVVFGASFVPTDTTDYANATAAAYDVTIAGPVQGTPTAPISLYVDTILASGATGALAPEFGAGCEITNEFIVGQTIVFRVYGNDWSLGGAPLTPVNVSSADVVISGVTTPLALAYGNHGGVAFWTAALATGTAKGDYDTLGIIPYEVTFNTISVPAVTKVVTMTKLVPTIKNGKKVVRNGHVVTHRVSYKKTVVVTPAVPGASATFQSDFSPTSIATLNALPAA